MDIKRRNRPNDSHDSKILDFICDVEQSFVHFHASLQPCSWFWLAATVAEHGHGDMISGTNRVPIMTKSNNHDAIFFAQNCLVDSVTAVEMGQHVTHLERISMLKSFLVTKQSNGTGCRGGLDPCSQKSLCCMFLKDLLEQ
jgi:hypothetical protein